MEDIVKEIRGRITKVVDILIRREVATHNSVRGCTPGEIAEIEADVGHPLPLAYREFLSRMGKEAGAFYVGTNLFYPGVLGITKAAHRLVAEVQADLILPEDAIAFAMHQGYQFLFTRAGDGDDPPVYYHLEGSGEFEKKADQLTGFLMNVANDPW